MHLCVCGHGPSEHEELKRCRGECIDAEYGRFVCVCPIYQREEGQ